MYKSLNDYELLYMVSENEENTFNILYQKYSPMIYKMVKKYEKLFKRYGYDLDDLLQIGYITLYKASYLYNNYDSSLFFSYYKVSLKNAIMTEARKNETLKKEVLNSAFSYDELITNTDISFIDLIPSKEYVYDEDKIKFIIDFKNSMSFELSNIFELYYNGYSFEEISILLDKDIKVVKEGFKEIKQHALTYGYLFLK